MQQYLQIFVVGTKLKYCFSIAFTGIKAAQDPNQKHTARSIFARTPRKVWIVALIFIFVFGALGMLALYATLQKVQGLTLTTEEEQGPPETRFSNVYASNTSKFFKSIFLT